MSHPDLSSEPRDRLMASIHDSNSPDNLSSVPGPELASEPVLAAPLGRKARLKAAARAAVRPAADPALDRLTALVSTRLRHLMRSEYDDLAADVQLLRAEQTALRSATEELRAFFADPPGPRLDAAEINLELMKGELGAFQETLDQLGRAIAPSAGLAGVPARFAELREQVNALDRQLRAGRRSSTDDGTTTLTEPVGVPSTAVPPAAGFDYVGFERRFRGDSDTVLATLAERYDALLREHQPVLDFGCGRGELVSALASRGMVVEGVDPDPGMVEEAQGHDRAVHLGDGLAYLRSLSTKSLGSVISVHVIEHLQLSQLVELLDLAASRLQPGGIFVAETPNPASLIVLGNSYILDPTHVWPLHPALMTFLAERAGFRDVEIRFYSPADGYRLDPIDAGPGAPDWVTQINVSLERLNDVLFGPQEYALVATMPPTDHSSAP